MVRKVVGLVEKVKVRGEKPAAAMALVDTGAQYTSVDLKLADKAKLGPVIRTAKIKNPSLKGWIRRPVVRAIVEIGGGKFEVDVNLQDRSHMSFPMIIGRDILAGNFVVDPQKNLRLFRRRTKGGAAGSEEV